LATSDPDTLPTIRRASPGERYYLLPPEDKVAILAFLCDAVVSHKEIHTYMETCEANLTQLRKEKIEVKKERKKMQVNVFLIYHLTSFLTYLPSQSGGNECSSQRRTFR
jgi:WSTF, HB1, Itc1p, MBD9 motif 1